MQAGSKNARPQEAAAQQARLSGIEALAPADAATARALADRFPSAFTWGAATAAYQVEGSVRADGRGESIWDRFSARPGAVAGGDTGETACDHYVRWREDIELMRRLGIGAYRFSVAWPRVRPAGRGPVNAAGLDWYDRFVDALLEAGIAPWVTLYHWDLPQVLEDAGGWPVRDTAEAFAEYASIVAERLGDRVSHFITVNEPWVVSMLGYGEGLLAPGRRDWPAALQAAHHLLVGHGLAVDAVRAAAPGARVGLSLNLTPARAASDTPEDRAAARRFDGHVNRWFLDPLAGRGYPEDMRAWHGAAAPAQIDEHDTALITRPIDFLGINYYMTRPSRHAPDTPPIDSVEAMVEGERTAMGWLCEPAGLTELLVRLDDEYDFGSLVITENGAAIDDDPAPSDGSPIADPRRLDYYATHVAAAADAIEHGVPLDGYFAWSLLDNFEWAEGYAKRFGLIAVDYDTQRRTPKHSALWYSTLIDAHEHDDHHDDRSE